MKKNSFSVAISILTSNMRRGPRVYKYSTVHELHMCLDAEPGSTNFLIVSALSKQTPLFVPNVETAFLEFKDLGPFKLT
jgi:hypothetical protein